MRDFVRAPQNLTGRKNFAAARSTLIGLADVTTSGPGSVTGTRDCQALIYQIGGGGSGGDAGAAAGGGGGGALYKRVRLAAGQTISYVCAAAGAASTVTLPSGVVLTAGPGGAASGNIPGAGGAATGGDINRTGGAGAVAGAVGSTATPGGGAGGASGAGRGGGGGAAGFSDLVASFIGGAGATGFPVGPTNGTAPGGGGAGCSGSTATGGVGRILIVLVKVQ